MTLKHIQKIKNGTMKKITEADLNATVQVEI